MGIAQIFFKKGNFISTVQLDIIVTESASATVRMTENPVENGANVNDHIIVEPMTFSTEGVVSNVSSSFVGNYNRISDIFNQDTARSKDAWNALLELQVSRIPFTLVQGLKEYNNVIILSLSQVQDKDTSNGLFFKATMKEFLFVGSEIITEEQFNDPDISDKMVPAVQGGLKQLESTQ